MYSTLCWLLMPVRSFINNPGAPFHFLVVSSASSKIISQMVLKFLPKHINWIFIFNWPMVTSVLIVFLTKVTSKN
jgi:hypothetical protein